MSTAVKESNQSAVSIGEITRVLVQGDLARLTEPQRAAYYSQVCTSLALNPLTRPFEFLLLGKGDEQKLVLYATKSCTEQLRVNHDVSVSIVSRETNDGVYIVTARATSPDGRTDESTGVVPIEREEGEWQEARSGKRFFKGNGVFTKIRGEALANALMKAETKAKRRVTLSFCGLGMLDESEVDSIPDSKRVYQTDPTLTNEPQQQPPKQQAITVDATPEPIPDREPGDDNIDQFEVVSAEIKTKFLLQLVECKSVEEVKAVGNTITAKMKEQLTEEDLRDMQAAYSDTNKKLKAK